MHLHVDYTINNPDTSQTGVNYRGRQLNFKDIQSAVAEEIDSIYRNVGRTVKKNKNKNVCFVDREVKSFIVDF